MLRGFYNLGAGVLTDQRRINVLSNNIANIKTPGFKTERVVTTTFGEEMQLRKEGGRFANIGPGTATSIVEDVPAQFDPSSIEETGRPFDMSINGNGFFNIATENEQFLTRNGNFDIDEEGYLILRGVGRVQGQEGDIQVNGSNFTVSEEGIVFDESGRRIDTLLLTNPENPADLVKFVNGLYTYPQGEEGPLEPDPNVRVIQGSIERSNIDMNREYTLVMEAQRSFQACSKALQMIDQLNQKTANQIAAL